MGKTVNTDKDTPQSGISYYILQNPINCMLQQSKGNKIMPNPTIEESSKYIRAYFVVSLGILFSLSLFASSPAALADGHFTIYIEHEDNCTNDSCLSEEGLVVKQGSTVTWINNDSTFHSVYSGFQDSGRDGEFESSMILPGEGFSVEFKKDGYYHYYCNTHPWMKGMIQVSS